MWLVYIMENFVIGSLTMMIVVFLLFLNHLFENKIFEKRIKDNRIKQLKEIKTQLASKATV